MSLPKMMLAMALAVSQVAASPVVLPTLPKLVARQGFGQCRNQSCEIATIAGSTGATVYPYTTYPTGDSQDGDCCIIRYFPAVKQPLYDHRPGLEAYCAANGGTAPADSNPPGVSTVSAVSARSTPAPRTVEERAACKPNILIFVKGTLEPGDTGITVGPMLSGSLDSKLWSTVGVNYDNSFDNDQCLGLPGGINARTILAQQVAACPNSNIAMAGYSQGAMVVRNALARAAASDVAHVNNVITFGDPFDGARIGQYSGPLNVFCMTNDGVCNGQEDIGLAHLSYGVDVGPAADILKASQKTS